MFIVFQIITLFLLFLLLTVKVKKNIFQLLFSAIGATQLTVEIASVLATQTFVDYRFYTHINFVNFTTQVFQFKWQLLVAIIIFIILAFLLYFLAKKLRAKIPQRNNIFILSVLILSTLLTIPDGIVNKAYSIYKILNTEERTFKQALLDSGIKPQDYIEANAVKAESGKNLIVISIESLEQGFLKEPFRKLTPNLNHLASHWLFFDKMPVIPGAGWTAGSLYTHQVGIPAFFKGQGNDLFQGIQGTRLTGLGNILNKAHYQTKYIVGNPQFAGTSDLLRAYGIDIVSQTNTLGKYPQSDVGLNDLDIFEEAKLQIKQFRKNDKPFALFLSTINTHFPDGIYDKRMEQFISKQDNGLEFSVSAIDYLIGDFISYLEKHKLIENTVLYIFPDHLLMGSTGSVQKKLQETQRQLYLITNANPKTLHKSPKETIYQLELPRLIIDGTQIKSNAKFLSDFISKNEIIPYLQNNITNLTALNTASVIRSNYQKGINIDFSSRRLKILSGPNHSRLPVSENKDEVFDFTFTPSMVLIEKQKKTRANALEFEPYDKKYKRLHLIIFTKNGEIEKIYLGNKEDVQLVKKGKNHFSENEISQILQQNDH